MKEKLFNSICIFIFIVLTPYIITLAVSGTKTTPVKTVTTQNDNGGKRVIISGYSGEQSISLEEYIIGVVAAEMPINFENEALKAQAIAARTYALKKMGNNNEIYQTDLSQSYMSKEKMQDAWGVDKFIDNYSKLEKAINDTKGLVIEHNNELIEAVFHSTSGGMTQNAKDIWGTEYEYLISVDSQTDIDSPKYLHIYTLTNEEIANKIKSKVEDFEIFSTKITESTQIVSRNEAGYILSIQIGNKIFSGEEVREYLELSSSNFTIEDYEENVRIICKGYGHGVGMSQYGANSMAENGSNYEDILKHYYKDISIVKLDNNVEDSMKK